MKKKDALGFIFSYSHRRTLETKVSEILVISMSFDGLFEWHQLLTDWAEEGSIVESVIPFFTTGDNVKSVYLST